MARIPSYKKAINAYNKEFKNKELSKVIPLESNEEIIVRLDGKNLSKCFSISNENKNYLVFYDAIRFVMSEIIKYFQFICIAYSFKDEISFLINKKKIKTNSEMKREQKILSLLSGAVSSLFTQYMNLTCNSKSIYYFDARIILVEKDNIFDYFECRNDLSIRAFCDSARKYIEPGNEWKLDLVKKDLKDKNISYNNYMINGTFAVYLHNKIKVKEYDSNELKTIINTFNKL